MIVENEQHDFQDWDQFVHEHAGSKGPHLSGWKSVIETTFGHDCYYLAARDNGRIKGVLPLTHFKSSLFGSFLVSVPFLNYGGIVTDDSQARENLRDYARQLAVKLRVSHVEYRHEAEQLQDLPTKQHKVAMLLDLPEESEILWKNFKAKLRSQIRRPKKEGLVAKIGREDELDNFYSVFSTNMRDLGTPVYSKLFFRNILTQFPDRSWICSVYRDDVPYASGFLFGFRDVIEIPWASSLREYNRLSPNMLLYWTALEFAIQQGFSRFDFGRSTPGEGTYRFKQQWGAKPVALHWQYWLSNGGELPDMSPQNNKYQLAIQIWQKMPLALTRVLGPAIIKNIP